MKKYCRPQARRQTRKHGGTYKQNMENCRLVSCNPTCQDTSFGPNITLPAHLAALPRYAAGAEWRAAFEKKRKRLFGSRKNILRKGFYAHMPAAVVKSAKKQGAISGCFEGI
jgi:hypothetical protein